MSKRLLSQIGVAATTLLLVVGVQVFAYTEPTGAPPGNDAYAPLNTGPTAQTKTGGLIVNTGGATNGFSVALGNVGIGTQSPGGTLDVENSTHNATICLNGTDSAHCTTSIGSGGGGGGTNYWTLSGTSIYNNSSTNVGIDTTSPGYPLTVAGEAWVGSLLVNGNITTGTGGTINTSGYQYFGQAGYSGNITAAVNGCQILTLNIGGGIITGASSNPSC